MANFNKFIYNMQRFYLIAKLNWTELEWIYLKKPNDV